MVLVVLKVLVVVVALVVMVVVVHYCLCLFGDLRWQNFYLKFLAKCGQAS